MQCKWLERNCVDVIWHWAMKFFTKLGVEKATGFKHFMIIQIVVESLAFMIKDKKCSLEWNWCQTTSVAASGLLKGHWYIGGVSGQPGSRIMIIVFKKIVKCDQKIRSSWWRLSEKPLTDIEVDNRWSVELRTISVTRSGIGLPHKIIAFHRW